VDLVAPVGGADGVGGGEDRIWRHKADQLRLQLSLAVVGGVVVITPIQVTQNSWGFLKFQKILSVAKH
jgi:hypothetical protein